MASISSSLKPFAMRSITVAGRRPLRNSCSAFTIEERSAPASRGTAADACAEAAWQPEHAEAPGGGTAEPDPREVHAAASGPSTAAKKPLVMGGNCILAGEEYAATSMASDERKTGTRVAPVAPGTRPELAELETRIAAARGRISPLYQVLLNSPAVASGWERLLTAIRQQTSLPPRLRELVILRIAVLNGATYEFEAHRPHALKAGLTEEALEHLRDNDLHRFGDLEKLALLYTDTMTREIEVPDALFAQLKTAFRPQALVELTATIAAYNMVSRLLVALRIE